MNSISKISEITYSDLQDYLRIAELQPGDQATLENLLTVAKAFIRSYTGLEDIDAYQDLVIVAMILVQDMWDNRTMYVDSGNLNYVVETILGMHQVNLL